MPQLTPPEQASLDELSSRMQRVRDDAGIDAADPHSAVLDAQLAVCRATLEAASFIRQSHDEVLARTGRAIAELKSMIAAPSPKNRRDKREISLLTACLVASVAGCLAASAAAFAAYHVSAKGGLEATAVTPCEPINDPEGTTSWRCTVTWHLPEGSPSQ